jgi:methionine biosynthesis protein MetW
MKTQAYESYESIWARKLSGDFESGRARIVSQLVPSETGDRLLDIGCGNGEMGKYFVARYREVHGIDISDTVLQAAIENGVIAKKVNLNYEFLPYDDHFFDMVTCLDVIEHIFDPYHLLSDTHRVLKPGGMFILSFPNIGFIKFRLSLLRGTFPSTSSDTDLFDGGHIHYFSLSDMYQLLFRYSFTPVAVGATGRWVNVKRLWPNLLVRNPFIVSHKSDQGA